MSAVQRALPADLAAYPAHCREKLRYGDTDRQGHVNNAVFATLFESGRVSLLHDAERPLRQPGAQFVIARLSIDFIAELNWPGEVVVGTGVLEVGRSSFRVAQAIFDGERRVAQAESVMVLMDEATRKSTPLPDGMRDGLAALTLKG